jgi:polyisoprenoid-binding protein YceI
MHTEPEQTATTPQLGHYRIDPNQSAVTFRTRHLFGLAPVHGTFAIKAGTVDVTRPVRLSVARCAVSRQSFTARATARIDRTEFGITAARGLAGRYLDVTVEVQCIRN